VTESSQRREIYTSATGRAFQTLTTRSLKKLP